MKRYDLVVIGGGPAGVSAARTAAMHHKAVALVNSDKELGGAGINTGTLPSKTLRETALALSGAQSRKLEARSRHVARGAVDAIKAVVMTGVGQQYL